MMEKSVSEDERAWFISPLGNESEDGDRVSFPRWGKRNVISNHFTELYLEIMETRMHTPLKQELILRKVLYYYISHVEHCVYFQSKRIKP